MSDTGSTIPLRDRPPDYFVTTRWSVVISAGHKSSPESEAALLELCQTYWYPLYAYVRRHGRSREDAEDLVQGFFERFLHRSDLSGLRSEHGRFRAFLLACLKNFLANEADKAACQKRGGGIPHLSLDWQSADDRFRLEPAGAVNPEHAFDRQWALALLEQVILRLQAEYEAAGKSALFARARPLLMLDSSAPEANDTARELGIDPGTFRVAVHRLRKRYRELLRDEIRQTLLDPAMLDEELRALQSALRA